MYRERIGLDRILTYKSAHNVCAIKEAYKRYALGLSFSGKATGMNKNLLIVFGGAIAIAVVVALLVQVSLGKKQATTPVQEARVMILVADKDLKAGHELEQGDVRWQSWPKSGVFLGAVERTDKQEAHEALKGRLARAISKDEPLLKNAIITLAKGNPVSSGLMPGQRAIAIEVSPSSMVGGFIGPGDYVDIILTYRENINTDEEDPNVISYLELNLDRYATETILQNVKILAIDQDAQQPTESGKAKLGKTATLAVNMQDAERLSLASQLGELNLVLRGIGDDQIVEKSWPTVSDARLVSINDEIYSGYKQIKKDAGINGNSVRIYRGDNVTSVR